MPHLSDICGCLSPLADIRWMLSALSLVPGPVLQLMLDHTTFDKND